MILTEKRRSGTGRTVESPVATVVKGIEMDGSIGVVTYRSARRITVGWRVIETTMSVKYVVKT